MMGLLAGALVAAACGGISPGAGNDGALPVVSTVAPITDLVASVGGDRADVVGLVPEGVNSHTFEPTPQDARRLSTARLFVANGLFLEEPSIELAEANLPDGSVVVTLADQTISEDEWAFDRSFPESGGKPNPHLWLNVAHAMEYVEHIADALVDVDPEGEDAYRANAEGLLNELRALDQAVNEAIATIPEANRKLVTYHDSWAYFGPRYGIEVISAIQPSDFAEPSASEVRGIIDQVRENQVPAVFGSEVFPSDVLATMARDTGATYVDELRDDDLPGEIGDPDHSYIGMMVFDVRTMVDNLGGDSSPLDALDPVRG